MNSMVDRLVGEGFTFEQIQAAIGSFNFADAAGRVIRTELAENGEIIFRDAMGVLLDSDGKKEKKDPDEISFGPGSRLGDILIARGLITQEKIDEALKLQDRLGKRMGRIIIDKGWVEENDVLRALSEQLGVPFVRLRPGLFDPATAATLERETGASRRVGGRR